MHWRRQRTGAAMLAASRVFATSTKSYVRNLDHNARGRTSGSGLGYSVLRCHKRLGPGSARMADRPATVANSSDIKACRWGEEAIMPGDPSMKDEAAIRDRLSHPLVPPKDNTFRLGLVLNGTVSAGAWTAGVLDFLIQA